MSYYDHKNEEHLALIARRVDKIADELGLIAMYFQNFMVKDAIKERKEGELNGDQTS